MTGDEWIILGVVLIGAGILVFVTAGFYASRMLKRIRQDRVES